MARVIFAPEADDDLAGIAAYIALDNPDAARKWVQLIREKCEIYATQPAMAEERHGFGVPGCRSAGVSVWETMWCSSVRPKVVSTLRASSTAIVI